MEPCSRRMKRMAIKMTHAIFLNTYIYAIHHFCGMGLDSFVCFIYWWRFGRLKCSGEKERTDASDKNKHSNWDIVSTTKLVPSSYLKVHTHVHRIHK